MKRKLQRMLGFLACVSVLGCAGSGVKTETADGEASDLQVASGPVHIALPRESTAVRDDRKAPILQVATSGNVVFPLVYGYPIYPEGDAAQGLLMLRRDNWANVKKTEREDDAGVVHEIEQYTELGCTIDGIRENVNKFVPLSIACDLPPPKAIGGAKRPVMNTVMPGAKAEQLLQDKTVADVFMGAFHLKTQDFDNGSGTGFFNTTHGQLAFDFSRKKLQRFTYYFDPGVKGWQNPTLWVTP